jgi:hypothetical protein
MVNETPKMPNVAVKHFSGTEFISTGATRLRNSRKYRKWRIFSDHA